MILSRRDQICTRYSVKNLLKAGMSGRQVKTLFFEWPLSWYVFSNHFLYLVRFLDHWPSTSVLLVVLVSSICTAHRNSPDCPYSFSLRSCFKNEIICCCALQNWLPGVLWGVWLCWASSPTLLVQGSRKAPVHCSGYGYCPENNAKGELPDPWGEAFRGCTPELGLEVMEWAASALASSIAW